MMQESSLRMESCWEIELFEEENWFLVWQNSGDRRRKGMIEEKISQKPASKFDVLFKKTSNFW